MHPTSVEASTEVGSSSGLVGVVAPEELIGAVASEDF
tara:strand:- start:2102 stop:2212 length:111 start_codon:yes stop_codon:yes gene_type:complete